MRAISAIAASSSFYERVLICYCENAGVIEQVISHKDAQYQNEFLKYQRNNALLDLADDYLLFASFGDIHIHAREDVSGLHLYKEDFDSVKEASFNGGVLFACDMPNNPVAPIDDESYLAKLKLTMRNEFALLPYAGIGPGTHPLTFLVPYKAYMGHSVGELFFKDSETLSETMKNYRGQYVSFHCEDPWLLETNKEQKTHFKRRPIEAEIEATKYAIFLAEENELRAKLCHYSSGDGLSYIREARKKGLEITCEVTPQHLYFSEEEILQKDENSVVNFQMNPPIRKKYDRDLLLNAFKNGEIDYLATDHAPHSLEEKEKGMSGLTGLDTYSGFVSWLIVEKQVDPKIIAKTCAENPGDFYNTFHQKWIKSSLFKKINGEGLGHLQKNYSASFTILNLNSFNEIKKNNLKTKAMSSPFLGITFPGKCEYLFLNGKQIY